MTRTNPFPNQSLPTRMELHVPEEQLVFSLFWLFSNPPVRRDDPAPRSAGAPAPAYPARLSRASSSRSSSNSRRS